MDRVAIGTHVPVAFKRTLFEDYDVSRRKGSRRLFQEFEAWEPTDNQPAALLCGPPGVGKTMLAAALLNEYHEGFSLSKKVDHSVAVALRQQRCPVYFIQLAELIDLHLRSFQLQRDLDRGTVTDSTEYLEIDTLLQDLKNRVKVLVIDDVGKEHRTSSGFSQDSFDLLVRTRHNAGLTTVYTTNIPTKRWSAQYSESMQNLIERSSIVLDFN